jgi:RNA polymerase sigma-70 factor (ECF subfamily)
LQDAFAAALAQWPTSGIPGNPSAWLVSTGRFKAIDRLRREKRFVDESAISYPLSDAPAPPKDLGEEPRIEDDRLRLIFTCCHPALAPEARVALTLRVICGLSPAEIARAFLVPETTLQQRLVRAKSKIRDAGIPYVIPDAEELPERLDTVLAVIYLVFNEGYSATAGSDTIRADLCQEAIRLARLVVELLPAVAEAGALLGLMLLHHSRRGARTTPTGDLVILEDQDRSQWDQGQIAEGIQRVEEALRSGFAGPYAVEGAIAALHAQAKRWEETDWRQIAALYQLLLRWRPSAVVELNHAVAVAMADGPAEGLRLVDSVAARGGLEGYRWLPIARGELLRRLGRNEEAAREFRTALAASQVDAERRFLERRLAELS